MANSVMVNPSARIDLMVPEKHWAQAVSIVQSCSCWYAKDDKAGIKNGEKYVILRDIQAAHANDLATVLGRFLAFEKEPESKFYILVRGRRKERKHDQENRKEAGAGSEGGNPGESGTVRPGEADEPRGDSAGTDRPGTADICRDEDADEEGFVTVFDSHQ